MCAHVLHGAPIGVAPVVQPRPAMAHHDPCNHDQRILSALLFLTRDAASRPSRGSTPSDSEPVADSEPDTGGAEPDVEIEDDLIHDANDWDFLVRRRRLRG